MDDLKQVWKDIQVESDKLSEISKDDIKLSMVAKSKGIMHTLKHKVLTKFWLFIFVTVLLAVYIPFADPLPSKILLMVMLGAYLVGDMLLFREYKELEQHIDQSTNLYTNLTTFRDRIKKVLKYEELIGLAIYPISVTAGFMIGMALGSDDGFHMDDTLDWVALVVVMIIATPLADWVTKSMNKQTFGAYLQKLDKNIDELKLSEDEQH